MMAYFLEEAVPRFAQRAAKELTIAESDARNLLAELLMTRTADMIQMIGQLDDVHQGIGEELCGAFDER